MANTFFRDKYYGDTYRGADLTKLGKTIQSVATQISKNDFSDLYIGDYFPITMYSKTVKWCIADINYFLNVGDTSFTKPHLVLINDIPILNEQMNTSNNTIGGYPSSKMRKTTIPNILNTLNTTQFKSHILTHRELFGSEVDNNVVSGGYPLWTGCCGAWDWYDSTLELLTEPQVYGCSVFSSSGYDIGSGFKQFSIFKLDKTFINYKRSWWWLRAVASSTKFCTVSSRGYATANNAAELGGVRLYFCFGN